MLNLDVLVDFFRWLAGMEPQNKVEPIRIPVETEQQHPQRRVRRSR